MSEYGPRIAALARRSERDLSRLEAEPAAFGPDDADQFLVDGVGDAVGIYVEGRTGGELARFSGAEFEALEGALNDWLTCYARCHGVDTTVDATVREAAALLLETGNVIDVGQLLTGVPSSDGGT